jgi:Kef-type K+ transport system membrane component KefB/Trk K+ transport system NAD-binding subunit
MALEVFLELTVLLLITTLVSGVMRLLKQPLLIGYILTGILVGPYVFNIMDSTDTLSTFAHIGISFLLFMVGLHLNPKMIKDVGKISLITGIGQVLFTVIIGFCIGLLLGFSTIQSMYIAIALTFSSTIIIMKLLSDRNDLESLYGRIATGFLIVQDIIAILMLIILASYSSSVHPLQLVLTSVVKGGGLLFLIYVFSKHILPKIIKSIAKTQEFLLLFSICWCFTLAALFYYLQFSIEAGALLAGVALSMSPYHSEISSKMKTLRDFFIILFFILLGSQMVFTNISSYIVPVIVFSVFILIGNPIIVLTLMGIMGYTRRNGFMAGLTVAQISEFSLVLISLGVAKGALTQDILSVVTFIGLITIAGSTYMILYADPIYKVLNPYLKIFERKGKKKDEHKYNSHETYKAVLIGYNRVGFDVLESFKKMSGRCLVIDHNPETIIALAKKGFESKYGDINDPETFDEINLSKTKMVVSTIPSIDTNLILIRKVHEVNAKSMIIVISHQIDDAMRLYEAGATYVIMPHFLGGKHIATMIENHKLNVRKFLKEKAEHLDHLAERKKAGHEHPKHHK